MGRTPKWIKTLTESGARLHEASGLYVWPNASVNRDRVYKGIYITVKDWDGKTWMLHRLVAECFIPNPDNKPVVNHKDGNKHNARVENLEWATHQENSIHAWETGLSKHVPRKKFTTRQIHYIRRDGVNFYNLAEKYGVSYGVIYNIHYCKTYKNVARCQNK